MGLRMTGKCREENGDERVRVEGWVIDQWWGGSESDGLLMQRERKLRKDRSGCQRQREDEGRMDSSGWYRTERRGFGMRQGGWVEERQREWVKQELGSGVGERQWMIVDKWRRESEAGWDRSSGVEWRRDDEVGRRKDSEVGWRRGSGAG
jgi:hypothetical protein